MSKVAQKKNPTLFADEFSRQAQRDLNKIAGGRAAEMIGVISQAGGLDKVGKSSRIVIAKAKRFSDISEKP